MNRRQAAGTALLMIGSPSQARVDATTILDFTGFSASVQDETALARGDSAGIVETVSIPDLSPPPWTAAASNRFRELVDRRADGIATPEDNLEFQQLQKARRLAEEDTSPDEILAECRRRRFYNEMLEVLKRNVEFLHPKDYTKLRSFR